MIVARLRTYAGLAAAIVPCAIIVHLVAEAAAVGHDGLGLAFLVRHSYFGVLFAAAALWFGTTAGVGRPARERRRRCALLRADLAGDRGVHGIAALVAANLGFFALTQAVEGVPIATGALWLSLGIAFAASVAAALLVFFFGHAIAVATIDSVIGRMPRREAPRGVVCRRAPAIAITRHATFTYSLNRPNRPPPLVPHI